MDNQVNQDTVINILRAELNAANWENVLLKAKIAELAPAPAPAPTPEATA